MNLTNELLAPYLATSIDDLAMRLDDRDGSCRELLTERLPIIFNMIDGNIILDVMIEATAYDLALELITLCFLITNPDLIFDMLMIKIEYATLIIS